MFWSLHKFEILHLVLCVYSCAELYRLTTTTLSVSLDPYTINYKLDYFLFNNTASHPPYA